MRILKEMDQSFEVSGHLNSLAVHCSTGRSKEIASLTEVQYLKREGVKVAWWKKENEQTTSTPESKSERSITRNSKTELSSEPQASDGRNSDELETKYGTVRSALGVGTVIQGRLSFDTPVRIDGSLVGEIFSSSVLIVGPEGSVSADINVETLIILGSVSGEIKARKRLEVFSSGEVVGNISTPSLVVEDGAYFDGVCAMTSSPSLEDSGKDPKTLAPKMKTPKNSAPANTTDKGLSEQETLIPIAKQTSDRTQSSASVQLHAPKITESTGDKENPKKEASRKTKMENAVH